MSSIPTTYNGIRFRSRLEARWAAYFDFRGDIKWDYEPLEMPGWIPDFSMHLPIFDKPFLAEVKPIFNILQFGDSRDGMKVADALVKDSKKEKQFAQFKGFFVLGNSPEYWWFCTKDSWEVMPPPREDLVKFWNLAGNCTQWRGH
jgi:hypothetical protein